MTARPRSLTRRLVMAGALGCAVSGGRLPPAQADERSRFRGAMEEIEAESGGRLGVAVYEIGTGRSLGYRAAERFPLCSTFKVLASAAILARVEVGRDDLGRRIVFAEADLVPYSPVTETRVGGAGMSLAELCDAAITRSDNTAGNLLLRTLGGPSDVTEFARSIGDPVTRLDRWETDLNEALPGDPRDTTTPDAMAADLRALLFGDVLAASSRDQLAAWLVASRTGDARLRAGFPKGWRVGDKTGSGERGTANDVAVVWPPGRAPLIACVYLTGTEKPMDVRNAAIADIARAVAATVE